MKCLLPGDGITRDKRFLSGMTMLLSIFVKGMVKMLRGCL
ncbi:MAG: hypothetical protein JETT_2998 [Candidatus Jettenia ecosi]|uniref:Uncharacterized protein n=1 Tax=Candidatus Jettenia ecosi TaxID=2494326 RepID=A0A533Q7W6_9BACT|nr:MAG: hypothetical protein JETT_2998 [Candidatus Jettenia ecosi]